MEKILIVGATSGIGEGLARRYAKCDEMKIGVMGRRQEQLECLCASCPEKFEMAVCDITDATSVGAALRRLAERMEGIDLLILSAGVGDLNPRLDYTVEFSTLSTNVMGWTAVVDWTVRYFERQGHGLLAAITSVGGLRGSGVAPAYNASKAFQINYLEGIRQRLAGKRLPVYVTDIRPGFVDTAMAKGEGVFWVSSVEKACRQIMRAIERRKNVAYITRRWRIAAWIYRHVPEHLFLKMGR